MEVQQEVNDGVYDDVFAGEEELADEAKGEDIDAEAAEEQLEELEAQREEEAEEEEEETEGEGEEEGEAEEEEEDAEPEEGGDEEL